MNGGALGAVTVRDVDVLVVGGGPSGLAAGAALAVAGAGSVEILDREADAGGVPRHCGHAGFGWRDLHRLMTGPAYAARCVANAQACGARVRPAATATGWGGPLTVQVTSAQGLELVRAKAVVLATGARERPRSARLVPGSRPAGVYTTGELQQSVYLHHESAGSCAVVVGAELVSLSAVLTLAHAGVRVAAMVTPHPRGQLWPALRMAAQVRGRFPLMTGSQVTAILGRGRVDAVEVTGPRGPVRVGCDTVVFTGDWVPDHELAVTAGVDLDPGSRGPVVDQGFGTGVPGVFAVGNLVHPVRAADIAASDGAQVVRAVLAHLSGAGPRTVAVPVQCGAGLRWVSPSRLVPGPAGPGARFSIWPSQFVRVPVVDVRQGSRLLHRQPLVPGLAPNRPASVSARWVDRVDPSGPPVLMQVTRAR